MDLYVLLSSSVISELVGYKRCITTDIDANVSCIGYK